MQMRDRDVIRYRYGSLPVFFLSERIEDDQAVNTAHSIPTKQHGQCMNAPADPRARVRCAVFVAGVGLILHWSVILLWRIMPDDKIMRKNYEQSYTLQQKY
jgi:hypothetical protein